MDGNDRLVFQLGERAHIHLVACLEDEVLPKWFLLLKKKAFAPMGANCFLYEMTPVYMGCNKENGRVASPESVPIYLNLYAQYLLFLPYVIEK